MAGQRRDPWDQATYWGRLLALAVGIACVGAIAIALGRWRFDQTGLEFWADVARAGVQIIGVSTLGVVVTAGLDYLARRRESRAHRNEARIRIYLEIVDAYNEAKRTRRELRSLGFLVRIGPLSNERVSGLRTAMSSMNVAQLKLEAIGKELDQSNVFTTESVKYDLEKVEGHLGHALKDWEEHGPMMWEGVDDSVLDFMSRLKALDETDEFRSHVTGPLEEIAAAVRADCYGGRT